MLPALAKIFDVEAVLKSLPQVELETNHFLIPGVYARVMEIPAGVALTGKIHLKECISIVAKGLIAINNGINDPVMLEAGWVGISTPGLKRAGYAVEDTVFITVHFTEKTDIEDIESELVCETFDDYQRVLT